MKRPMRGYKSLRDFGWARVTGDPKTTTDTVNLFTCPESGWVRARCISAKTLGTMHSGSAVSSHPVHTPDLSFLLVPIKIGRTLVSVCRCVTGAHVHFVSAPPQKPLETQ